MNISRYSFSFKGQTIEGALLEEGGAYSLIQPWVSLGDPSLSLHLEDLKGKRSLPLTQRALEIMAMDKKAKDQKYTLIPQSVPASHVLVGDEFLIEAELLMGVRTFKIKIGDDLEKELSLLNEIESKMNLGAFHLRLDANMKFSLESAKRFFSQLSEKLLCAIEFVEDPLRGTEGEWRDFADNFNLKIAHDFAPAEFREVADVWVLKPSRQNPWPWVEKAAHDLRRIVITTALDHPLGQVIAAYEASKILERDPLLIDDCGLLSQKQVGIESPLKRNGAYLDCSDLNGYGFALGSMLSKLKWEDLS
ncbi:MAG: enolase C-terminal domain-like protein [Bdellovibrionota bacterium]